MPDIPGNLGVTPFQNRNPVYQDFLGCFKGTQMAEGKEVWTEIPNYASEYMVDSTIALVNALSLTLPGISGQVSFTPDGDPCGDPKYNIFNLQRSGN
jgi:hypothetical protein